MIGERQPYVVALITADEAEVEKASLSREEVRASIERAIADVNATLGRVEQVKRFALLERDFSQDEGEITPTLKLRRRICKEHFREEIEGLYS